MKKLKHGEQGFTLIEILVVIVIIGIISAIAVLSYTAVQRGIRDKLAQTRLAVFADAENRFRVGLGRGRYATACELANTTSNTGEKLIPETIAKFENPTSTCEEVPVDGWYVTDGLESNGSEPSLRKQFLIQLVKADGSRATYCISEDGILRKSDRGACSRSNSPVE